MGTDKSKKCVEKAVQRREYFRVASPKAESFPVKLTRKDGKLIDGRLMNISIGGASVAVPRSFVLAWGPTIKEIVIPLPDGQEIKCSADVIYSFGEPDSDWNTYGIQFTGLSNAQKNIIEKSVGQIEVKKIKER